MVPNISFVAIPFRLTSAEPIYTIPISSFVNNNISKLLPQYRGNGTADNMPGGYPTGGSCSSDCALLRAA